MFGWIAYLQNSHVHLRRVALSYVIVWYKEVLQWGDHSTLFRDPTVLVSYSLRHESYPAQMGLGI